MRTFIKIILAILILAIIAIVALPFFIDPNDYKPQISEQVKKATGRELVIDGDIGLSVFPWVALDLGKVTLSNAPGFTADTFAQVESANVRVKLMPLLKQQLEIDTIALDGLVLNLERNKQGITNWADLAGDSKDKPSDTSAIDLAAISIAGVNLTNANIHWLDQTTGENYQLNKFNLKSDALVFNKPMGITTDFDIVSVAPPATAHITLDTQLILDLNTQHYQLSNLNFTTNAQSQSLGFEQANIKLTGDIDANLTTQKLSISGLALTAKTNQGKQQIDAVIKADVTADLAKQSAILSGLNLTADIVDPDALGGNAHIILSGDATADLAKQIITLAGLKVNSDITTTALPEGKATVQLTAGLTADLSQQLYQLAGLAINADISSRDIPNGKAQIKLTSDVIADLSKQTLSLPNLVLKAEELSMTGKLNGTKILSDSANFTGNIQLAQVHPRQLATKFGIKLPPMSDAKALTSVQLNTSFDASVNHFNASKLDLAFDQSKLTGQFGIRNFSQPALTFKLSLDNIDLDRYLPPTSEKAASPAASAGAAADLPLDSLRQLNAKGSINIGNLKASGISSKNIHITVSGDKGLVSLNPLKAQLYQGSYQGNVQLDARGKTLNISVDEKLTDVQVEPLLTALNGSSKISGTANAHVKLSGAGNNTDQIKQSLSGKGNFTFSDGALKGINIAHTIRKAKAAVTGQTLAADSADLKTNFSSFSGSFTANKGVINNQDLKMVSPLLRVNGAGKANLGTEAIDYGLTVAVVGSLEGQDAKDIADLKGLSIPLKITGTFANPKPRIDLAALMQEQAKEKVKAALAEKINTEKLQEKLNDKLGEQLGDTLGDSLGGLLGIEKPKPTEQVEGAPTSRETAPEMTLETEPEPEKSLEDETTDALKDKLRSFF